MLFRSKMQFQQDYMCVIMDSDKHYDIIYKKSKNGLFLKINGISYRRLFGTNGGIKKSTIIFINVEKYDMLMEKINCGSNMEKTFVLAKLEAYKALSCTGSIALNKIPHFIVVDDCETTFNSDVIFIDDSITRKQLFEDFNVDNEPSLEIIKNKECQLTESDGYGLMSPELSMKINNELYENDID